MMRDFASILRGIAQPPGTLSTIESNWEEQEDTSTMLVIRGVGGGSQKTISKNAGNLDRA